MMNAWSKKHYLLPVIAVFGLLPGGAAAIEDVGMNASVDIQDGHVVARWQQGGFDVYHLGWRENGGPRQALERAGDKRFMFLTVYHPGAVYDIEIQGCVKHTFKRDECTSWSRTSCGQRQSPCRAH